MLQIALMGLHTATLTFPLHLLHLFLHLDVAPPQTENVGHVESVSFSETLYLTYFK